jgi:hypothetical protein
MAEAEFKLTRRVPPLIYYSGKQVLDGKFLYYGPADENVGDQVCFYPDQTSARYIPRGIDDRRLPWFCFSNTKKAKALLRIDESLFEDKSLCELTGKARITVRGYVVDRTEGCVNDVSELYRVHRTEAPIRKHVGKTGECR